MLVFSPAAAPAGGLQQPWQARVDARVLQEAAQGETEFLVFLKEQADLSGAARLKTKAEKGAYVYARLSETARRSQGPLLAALRGMGVEYRPYWAANAVWVRGGEAAVRALANRPEVARLHANPSVRLQAPPQTDLAPEAVGEVGENISLLGAPQLWDLGITGEGVVVGGQDTGYHWEHPALKDKYRGWDGEAADHNYNWHDAIHEDDPLSFGANSCGFDSPEPCDDGSHGTHTLGTMVGADGSHQTGMAPGARWIGCRNMENGWGKPSTYLECYQWFIAPTDLNGENPDPAKAPHVINNSWSCPEAEGCEDPAILQNVVEAVRAAGILSVHSAGNDGIQGCGSVSEPAAIYDASFSVGATNNQDQIASFSSRGPVTADGSGRLKPDVVAPGVSINSTVPGGSGYGLSSGTSMAGPHVAGLAALLISADPGLAGDVQALEELITGSAVPLESDGVCGGDPQTVPNNVYGWGRVDAWAAYQALLPERALALSPDQTRAARPGSRVTYAVTLENRGSLADSVQLSYESDQGWPVTLAGPFSSGDVLELQPGARATLTLTLEVPAEATIGAVDALLLSAVSQGDPQVSAQTTLTTRLAYLRYLDVIWQGSK